MGSWNPFRRRGRFQLPDDWEDLVAARTPGWWDVPLDERTHIRDIAERLLGSTRWEAARGFELTPEVPVVIAAQAARPILHLDGWPYRNVGTVIVHATLLASSEERPGPADGVVSDDEVLLAGEAGHGHGPIVLAWDEVVWDLRHPRRGRNVVIHEFAHKLDMLDDVVDGTPPLGDDDLVDRWIAVCTEVFEQLEAEGSPVLDDYAAEDPGEFFAVASEAFFTRPGKLREHHAELYDVLAAFYRQDPAG